MVSRAEVLSAVDEAFRTTGRGLAPWPDPHPDRNPPEDQYSRLLDPGKWRILGARAEAWFAALAELSLGRASRGAAVVWATTPQTMITTTNRMIPYATGALPLVVARSRITDINDAGVTVGAGDPAVIIETLPDCGCDACDSGSAAELEVLDRSMLSVVTGSFRRLDRDDSSIMITEPGSWSATNLPPALAVDQVLADPTGWDEISGMGWL